MGKASSDAAAPRKRRSRRQPAENFAESPSDAAPARASDDASPAQPEVVKRRSTGRCHHSVYVVYLRNPKRDGRPGYYVGMTGLTPEQRFANHKAGVKAAGVVRRHGVRLVPRLYAHLNPMTYEHAKDMEEMLADSLRKRGYQVFGGH
jgi:predicted GIY-YIG superfamily endonuclease